MPPVNDIEKHCKWLSGTLFTLFIYITTILYKLFFIICSEEKVTILEFLIILEVPIWNENDRPTEASVHIESNQET